MYGFSFPVIKNCYFATIILQFYRNTTGKTKKALRKKFPGALILMVRPAGFEPATYGFEVRRSIYLRTHSKITSHFGISASGCIRTILITQSPRNSLLFLRLCSIGSYDFNLNLSANSVNLFLSEP